MLCMVKKSFNVKNKLLSYHLKGYASPLHEKTPWGGLKPFKTLLTVKICDEILHSNQKQHKTTLQNHHWDFPFKKEVRIFWFYAVAALLWKFWHDGNLEKLQGRTLI